MRDQTLIVIVPLPIGYLELSQSLKIKCQTPSVELNVLLIDKAMVRKNPSQL